MSANHFIVAFFSLYPRAIYLLVLQDSLINFTDHNTALKHIDDEYTLTLPVKLTRVSNIEGQSFLLTARCREKMAVFASWSC
jgi:hypothetical protein